MASAGGPSPAAGQPGPGVGTAPAAASAPPSWLTLLHPDGPAAGPSEVSLLAPTAADLRSPGWLDRALARVARELPADGVAYTVVPRRWRLRAVRLASRHGLRVGPWLMHVPPWPTSLYLVPIEPRTLRHAWRALVPGHRWTRRLLPAMVASAPVLPFVVPSAGVVVRKPGARPLLEWLLRFHAPDGRVDPVPRRGTAVVAPGWRGAGSRIVLHRFPADEPRPDVVVKVAPVVAGVSRHAEADRLTRFGPDAERAGAIVPRPLAFTMLGSRGVLVQTSVPGEPAAVVLASRPERLPYVAERLTRWLGQWHALTEGHGAGHGARLASQVLDRLDPLATHVRGIEAYRRWLATRCEALSATAVPLVAAHNDLTMWNVLLGHDGALGVVDWDGATAAALPLTDFFYALADAVMATGRPRDRLAAVAACVETGGARTALVTPLWNGLAAVLALPAGLATLALHACWIHHGADALTEPPGTPGARVFVDIVRWLAERRVVLEPDPTR